MGVNLHIILRLKKYVILIVRCGVYCVLDVNEEWMDSRYERDYGCVRADVKCTAMDMIP